MGVITKIVGRNLYEVDLGFVGEENDKYICTPLSYMTSKDYGTGLVPSYRVNDRVIIAISDTLSYIIGSIPNSIDPLDGEFLAVNPEGAMIHLGARPESPTSGSTTGNVTISGDRISIVSGEEYKDWTLQTNKQYIDDEFDQRDATEIPSLPDEGVIVIRKDGEDMVSITMANGSVIIETSKDIRFNINNEVYFDTNNGIYFNTDSENGKSVAADGDTVDINGGTYQITNGVMTITAGQITMSPIGSPIPVSTPSTLTFTSIQHQNGQINISNGTLNSPNRKEKVEPA